MDDVRVRKAGPHGTEIQYFCTRALFCGSRAPTIRRAADRGTNEDEGVMMKKIAMLCALTAPVLVHAADEVGHWYVTPQIGGISVDNDRPLQDKDWLYGIGIGKHLSQVISAELNLNGAQVGGGPGRADSSLYGASLDLLAVANRGGTVSPYFSVGAGVAQNDRSPGKDATDPMLQAGVGMFLNLWENGDGSRSFALRPDLKVRWSEGGAEGMLRDYIGTLGFQFSFGAPAAQPVAATPEPPPAPTPPPAPPAPPAPKDSDNDGVLDNVDRCPDTPAGVAVDAYGCPRQGSITLEGVGFEVDSDRLTQESRSILDGIAADLKKYPGLTVELQGHTDSTGSDSYNLNLSQRRAESVRAYLIEQGVSASQLTAKGYGETQPVADNTTAAGRAQNRRVVMKVLSNPGNVKVEGTTAQ
jgi:OOP family OmpA-OmpF porin